jgi:large subunit ribosomal protein L22
MAENEDKEPETTEEPTPEPVAEEKPKPKRRSRAKKADAAKADEAKEEAAADEAEAEAAEADGEPAEEDEAAQPKTTSRRRRGGEATAGRSQPARRPRRDADPDLTVRARARYVRHAPRKARLVIDHIRGKDVDQARAILLHTPRAASRDVLKLLDSAIANAENNHDLVADDLKIGKAYVDEGPTLKRYRPRALGRATRIRKRTSHMTIELVSKG